MSTSVSSATPLTAAEIARRKRTIPDPGAVTPGMGTGAAPTETAATQQAAQGAQQAQAPQAEAFNAPRLELPRDPTTLDVMDGLARAMADKTVNGTTAQRLFQLHQQLMEAEKAMTQVVLDGIVS